MATSNLPTPQLQPIDVQKDLIAVVEDGASCCGGGCCSTN